MNHRLHAPARLAVLLIAATFASTIALADKPSWAGGEGKHGKKADEQRQEQRHEDRRDDRRDEHRHFDPDAQRAIHDYYGAEFRAGKCPPGLAKKHNGCLPPGQAKKWAMGQPLPAKLRYYELPQDLYVRLPPPPENHRYVRVASDILLIAVGTSMVVDAIQDIGGGR
jgi:Ni/Co efflux regulator RcnB